MLKTTIKKGQKWRCRNRKYCIVVGEKSKDNRWNVFPHGIGRKRTHRMEERSFHFYELVEE